LHDIAHICEIAHDVEISDVDCFFDISFDLGDLAR
jgi:hypothetical protein